MLRLRPRHVKLRRSGYRDQARRPEPRGQKVENRETNTGLVERLEDLTKAKETEVKKIIRALVDRLKLGLLVLDWKKRQHTRAAVQVNIQTSSIGYQTLS